MVISNGSSNGPSPFRSRAHVVPPSCMWKLVLSPALPANGLCWPLPKGRSMLETPNTLLLVKQRTTPVLPDERCTLKVAPSAFLFERWSGLQDHCLLTNLMLKC